MTELSQPLELSVRFSSKDENAPVYVSLFRLDSGTMTERVRFRAPLDDPELADLRWYLEVFSSWPTGPDYERAEGIKSRLEEWGRDLRRCVVGGSEEAARLWQQFVDAGADEEETPAKLLTVDATDPRVLRLPWELLADTGGHLFAQGIGVRRRLRQATGAPVRAFELPVRVLVVVSRPDDAGFIDPRAVSLPLLEALDELGERVVTEFLYPPTLEGLSKRLRDRRSPPVHVVHFDGHGVYDARKGLGYLLFEDEKHQMDRVDADQLGTLLNRCRVPLMVLNACQSAKQEESNPYASVAARLIRAGVGSVLAMNYSVLVIAARKFVDAFYGALADGLTVGQAVDEGRFKLLSDEKRHTITHPNEKGDPVEVTIRLRDWFLPALYQQATDPVVFPHPTTQPPNDQTTPLPRALTDPHVPGGLPAEPLHGFHGRSREMLGLERALAGHDVVVVHGFGGMGKTALAAEAGRWFQRTGRFPGGAAFVSFEHGGSLDQLCSWVGQAVSGDPDYAIHGAKGEGDGVDRVGQLLRERPALVILDNFESMLGREPEMEAEELKAVLDAVWRWVNPIQFPNSPIPNPQRPKLLITTRDTTFNDARYAPSRRCAHVELGGLAQGDALALAAAVLDDHGIEREGIEREALIALMDRLGGHPLSLYLVLPHLREHTPAELSAQFEALLPGFTAGAAVARNESLQVSLDFSLRRLGDETRVALPGLAVFQGAAFEDGLLEITEIDADLWPAARAELEAAALVSVESIPGVTPPFLRFHPTLLPYLAAHLPDDQRAALEVRYWLRYYVLANYLYEADIQTPHQARAVALRELPNLRRALDLAIAAGAATEAVDFATRIAKFLNNFGRWREREAMGEKVERLTLQVESGEGITKAELLLMEQRGDALLQRGRTAEAEEVFRELLGRLEAGAAFDAAYDRAMTLVRLGDCLRVRGWPTEAVKYHRRALTGLERLSESSDLAKGALGKVYTHLGINLAAIGRFDEAQQAYETSLKIDREVGGHRDVGVALGQLGTLALGRGDLQEAARRYVEALDIFRALGEPETVAGIWHQLGMVAEEGKNWEEAERCYREAVRGFEQLNDLPRLAGSCNQLALVARGAGRPGDAERWYLRAIELEEQLGAYSELGGMLSNLADLYLSQDRLEEAERYARRAIGIKETLDLSAKPWATYAILAQIAEAQGHTEEAAAWRRKEQESYAVYAGAAHEMRQHEPLVQAMVAACQGNERAKGQLEPTLQHMENRDEVNRRFAQAARRVLAGERDGDALTEGLDRKSAFLIRAILARLAGEMPSSAREGEGGTDQTSQVSEASDASSAPDPAAGIRAQWGPVVGAVVAACGGNANAAREVGRFIDEQLATQDDWRALAAALRRVLDGERNPEALLPGLDDADRLILGDVLRGLG
jgi:tetratricopeptide (TPR) repeat protein